MPNNITNNKLKEVLSTIIVLLSAIALIGCTATAKSESSFDSLTTTESTEITSCRIKGVVISGRTINSTETTVPSESAETNVPQTETTVPSESAETSLPTKAPTKRPTRKPAKKKKVVTKAPAKKKKKKKAPTPKPYTYCTCTVQISYVITSSGKVGSLHYSALTVERATTGAWKLTATSETTVKTWLNKNVKTSKGKVNWKSYTYTLSNPRDYRYKE